MRHSDIINYLHQIIIFYILFGWISESQRKYLLFFLPSIQFQFLINDNMCILTQLENRLLQNEPEKEKTDEPPGDSFVDKKLKSMNIFIEEKLREKLIHCSVFASFCITYFLS